MTDSFQINAAFLLLKCIRSALNPALIFDFEITWKNRMVPQISLPANWNKI